VVLTEAFVIAAPDVTSMAERTGLTVTPVDVAVAGHGRGLAYDLLST
jgi:hypothetical protein